MWNKLAANVFLISIILISAEVRGTFAFKNVTLLCKKYASQVMCEAPANISRQAPVEVNQVMKFGSLSQSELDRADVIVISRSRPIERLPQKLGNHFRALKGFLAIRVGLKVVAGEDFNNMSSLITLNLADNQLEVLPYDAFFTLTKLEVLFLDGNQFEKELPPALLTRCPNLTFFSAQFNRMRRVDDLFVENPNLKSALFGNNNITSVDLSLLNHTKLVNLDLRKNSEICKRCTPLDKELRVKNEQACFETKYHDAKHYHENFHNCTVDIVNGENSTIPPEFVSCTTTFSGVAATNVKNFNECAKYKNSSFDVQQKYFGVCLHYRLTDDNTMRENFERCVGDVAKNNARFKNSIANCTATKESMKKQVEMDFESCSFCKVDLEEAEMFKCGMQFTGGDLQHFKLELSRYFPNTQ
jgi:hypothetical protein